MWFDTKKVRACSSLLSKDGELAIKDACDEIDSLRAQVKTMEGELEETKKSCTWNDREAMTVKLAESQAQVEEMRKALQWAFDVLNHGEIPAQRKGHHCGPDSNWDGDCVDAARFADGMAIIHQLLGPSPTPVAALGKIRGEVWREAAREWQSRADAEDAQAKKHEAMPVSQFVDARTKGEIIETHGHVGMECLLMVKFCNEKAAEAEEGA